MGRLTDRSQLNWLQDARIGLLTFSANGGSSNVTAALTTALSTAGDEGVSMPLQVASATTVGLITSTPNNLCRLVRSSNRLPIADSNGNEVYGRLTQNAGVYTLTYFTLVGGTETAYSFGVATNIDFYPVYRFDAARLPKDAGVALSARLIQDDPLVVAGGGTTLGTPVQLNVTASNTVSDLPTAPTAANRVFLYVNGKAEFATGASPSFSHAGVAITWNAANAQYSLNPSVHEVYALVW